MNPLTDLLDAFGRIKARAAVERAYVRSATHEALSMVDENPFSAGDMISDVRELHHPVGIMGSLTVRIFLREQADIGAVTRLESRRAFLPVLPRVTYKKAA